MEDNQSFLDLQIDDQAAINLHETSRWAKFLAIAILSAVGLVTLIFVGFWSAATSAFQSFDEFDERNASMLKVIVTIALIIVLAIVVILMTFLLKGANAIKKAVTRKDAVLFNTGLAHIRNYFAMAGILSLLGLVIKIMNFFLQ
ncbi:MAG: hypothetical protein ABW007_19725 [Chitinophagaceae bacterium]